MISRPGGELPQVVNGKEDILKADEPLFDLCSYLCNGVRSSTFEGSYMPGAEGLDQRFDCRGILCCRQCRSHFDQLVGDTPLCRDDDGEFVPGPVVVFQNIHYAPDTLGIGDRRESR